MPRIKKTITELKQEKIINKFKKTRKKIKFKPKKYESINYLKTLSYSSFLNSKYWKLVRKKVLKRDNNQCVICKSNKFLQIHHDSYKNHFNELNHLEDLLTLCKNCHREHHYAQE